jgi:hypothetical protein
VRIIEEKEDHNGWSFRLRITAGGSGQPLARALRLAWADYNHWSADGADPPHAVAEAVAEFLLSRMAPSDLPASLDASMARRQFPDADREIPRLIRHP